MAAEHRITVEGAAKSLRILRNLDRELAKEISRELKSAVKPVVASAKGATPAQPLSNWGTWTTPNGRSLDWNRRAVANGLKVTQRTSGERISFIDKLGNERYKMTKQIAFLQLRNVTAAGHIFEIAGARNPGSVFNQNIMAKHGPPKRLLFKALEPREPQINAQVRGTIDKLERELTRRLKA